MAPATDPGTTRLIVVTLGVFALVALLGTIALQMADVDAGIVGNLAAVAVGAVAGLLAMPHTGAQAPEPPTFPIDELGNVNTAP